MTIPKYAIERQYLVPVYQHLFTEAPDLDAACQQALDHDDWDSSQTDYESSRETTIVCAVEIPCGEAGFSGGPEVSATEMIYQAGLPQLEIPRRFRGHHDLGRSALEVCSPLLELAESDTRGDDGPIDADRRRAILDQLGGEDEDRYTNFYCCDCGEEWQSNWSCGCNDECPACGLKDIELYESRDNEPVASD
jgi:hypothetical protein